MIEAWEQSSNLDERNSVRWDWHFVDEGQRRKWSVKPEGPWQAIIVWLNCCSVYGKSKKCLDDVHRSETINIGTCVFRRLGIRRSQQSRKQKQHQSLSADCSSKGVSTPLMSSNTKQRTLLWSNTLSLRRRSEHGRGFVEEFITMRWRKFSEHVNQQKTNYERYGQCTANYLL